MAQQVQQKRSGMTNGAASSRQGALWIWAQLLTPLAYAILIAVVIWGPLRPSLDAPRAIFDHIMVATTITLAYLAVQAISVVLQPLGSDVRPLADVLSSLVPLLVIALAAERAFSGYLTLNYYQVGILWIAALACLIDVVCFTLFTAKINRLAPDLVVNR